jgi:nucleoside-diphosphate-sugar epimerase
MSDSVGFVTGAHGLVGSYIVRELRDNPGWQVCSTGRRPSPAVEGVPYVRLDISDPDALREADLPSDVTHLFFAAYQVVADQDEEARLNLAMLKDTVDELRRRGSPLQHVSIYHGGKAYGAHLGAFKTPAKESDPRLLQSLFYYDQEDWLRTLSRDAGIRFTILRPDHICGSAFGPFVNLIHIIAMYATISKELGQPLRFPGTALAYRSLVPLTDVRLLARAAVWAASAPQAQDQIFNVSNGDLIRWANTWPKVASFFDMEVGPPFPYDLRRAMDPKLQAPVWDRIVAKYGLQPTRYEQFCTWTKASNVIIALERDLVSSTIKIRQAGFHDCMDSEDCVVDWLSEMRAARLIP